ncbi:hypothetical protein OLX02_02970 [Novosphingobium sp. KCTC 2891]|uniref:hypothetical protein n=1 Tax=Novosphingobium sp. KCTC 2891 TaxID=2989730 RepID=UPI002221ABD5|nr:hypothetical protein [Novosphingobium sp. KCTC 2891]MCW1381778.1 hypothetical protein [Novosphingobium sp. KCTC 2891]
MFIGHWSAAFAAGASRKAPSLGVLAIAAQFVDIAFFAFAMAGIEHFRFVPGATASNWLMLDSAPWTHSLLGGAGFALLLAVPVWLVTRRPAAAGIAALVVLSHWLLDLLVHRPDLTLAGAPPMLGLGLWNLPLIEKPVELALTFGALALYVRRRRPRTLPVAVLALTLLAVQAIDWFGPRTTDAGPSASLTAIFAYLLIAALCQWVGRSALSGEKP